MTFKEMYSTILDWLGDPSAREKRLPEIKATINIAQDTLAWRLFSVIADWITTTTTITGGLGNEVVATGNNVLTEFTFTLARRPIIPKTVSIADEEKESFTDPLGAGVLSGSMGGLGAIDYDTGVVTITFMQPPGDGEDITATYSSGEGNIFALPSNFLKLKRLMYAPDNNAVTVIVKANCKVLSNEDWMATNMNTFYTPSNSAPYARQELSDLYILPEVVGPVGEPEIALTYVKKPTTLSADGDISILPTQFHVLICQWAYYLVAPQEQKGNAKIDFENTYKSLMEILVADVEKREK